MAWSYFIWGQVIRCWWHCSPRWTANNATFEQHRWWWWKEITKWWKILNFLLSDVSSIVSKLIAISRWLLEYWKVCRKLLLLPLLASHQKTHLTNCTSFDLLWFFARPMFVLQSAKAELKIYLIYFKSWHSYSLQLAIKALAYLESTHCRRLLFPHGSRTTHVFTLSPQHLFGWIKCFCVSLYWRCAWQIQSWSGFVFSKSIRFFNRLLRQAARVNGEVTHCLFSLDLNNVLLAASRVILGAKTNKLICAAFLLLLLLHGIYSDVHI